jgi:alpha-N-acetylglucosamine transferase
LSLEGFKELTTYYVAERKKNRLVKDGAEVIVVEKLSLEWAKVRKQWQDVLTKLRLFELVQFDKVLFLDSDTIIRNAWRDFRWPRGTITEEPWRQFGKQVPTDEGQQPSTYLFAGNAGSGGYDRVYPPPKGNNFNAGCMVFRPSKEMFEYYSRLAKIKDRFPRRTPEQSLWSYAHRRDGNMPWKQLHHDWNVNWATWDDKEHGIASLHSKFWELDHDKKLQEFAMKIRWEMEGYWKGVEKDLQWNLAIRILDIRISSI